MFACYLRNTDLSSGLLNDLVIQFRVKSTKSGSSELESECRSLGPKKGAKIVITGVGYGAVRHPLWWYRELKLTFALSLPRAGDQWQGVSQDVNVMWFWESRIYWRQNLTLAFLFGLIIGGVSSSSSGGVLSLDLGVSLETSKSWQVMNWIHVNDQSLNKKQCTPVF